MTRFSFRPETPDDEPFVQQLVSAFVTTDLQAEAWPEPMRSHLVGIQYTARRQAARTRFPGAIAAIILIDGLPAGWAVTAHTEEDIWLVDLILAPEHRGKGAGSAFLQELVSDSDRCGKPLRLSVRPGNPALRLYERFGFRRTGGDELQLDMERLPARGSLSDPSR